MKTVQFLLLAMLSLAIFPNLQAQENEEVVYTEADVMPVFPTCETEDGAEAQQKCTIEKILNHVANNLVYPQIARENNIQGLVVLSFIINKEGKVETVKCIKDIGGGCGTEAIRVVELMNENKQAWTPGQHEGKTVKVKYHLPVRFRLDEGKKENDVETAPDEAPVVEEEEEEESQVYTVVENMPIFPTCETAGDNDAKKQCTDMALLKFVHENLNYPTQARKNNVEGLVIVSFIVDEEGKVEDVRCIKDIGGGCGAESIRVIESMNTKGIVWTPGTQRGKAVKVKYNLPVRFRLTSKKKKRWFRRNK